MSDDCHGGYAWYKAWTISVVIINLNFKYRKYYDRKEIEWYSHRDLPLQRSLLDVQSLQGSF